MKSDESGVNPELLRNCVAEWLFSRVRSPPRPVPDKVSGTVNAHNMKEKK